MSITIKDIAKDTHLSLATISKYLNGKNISKTNNEIIKESISRLGYIPNKSAQSLRSKKTNTICIMLPELENGFWGPLCGLIEEDLRKYNYSTMITLYDAHSSDNLSEFRVIQSKQVDGIVLVPENDNKINLPKLIQNSNIPFVLLDQNARNITADLVTSNNHDAAFKATKYLIENGHKKLSIIASISDSYTSDERIQGFKDACKECNISHNDISINRFDFSNQSSVNYFKKYLNSEHRPTALLLLNAKLTLGAIMTVRELNLKIPDDLSILSFDDDQIFSAFNPPITVIVQNIKEMSKSVTQLLIKRIQSSQLSKPKTKIIDTKFLIRKSIKSI